MRKYAIISMFFLIVVVGFFTGIYLYRLDSLNRSIETSYVEKEEENVQRNELERTGILGAIEASYQEVRISHRVYFNNKEIVFRLWTYSTDIRNNSK